MRGVDLDSHEGKVLALLGENGAGKSTLIKVLSGAHLPDSGTIKINGVNRRIGSPAESQRLGIAVIYQEFNLVPGLSARENIFLGQEKTRFGFANKNQERQSAADLFARLGMNLDPETLCRDLTVAQQQVVEIAKALWLNARILVMDDDPGLRNIYSKALRHKNYEVDLAATLDVSTLFNYPNPFQEVTRFFYYLSVEAEVAI
ncbi:MAG: ATP-binding cassette domain-containing protein, partial [Planctomycetes bacterium]|nr:ATP-binding cassette domain-containing protein [Planctomycetota bacterium]